MNQANNKELDNTPKSEDAPTTCKKCDAISLSWFMSRAGNTCKSPKCQFRTNQTPHPPQDTSLDGYFDVIEPEIVDGAWKQYYVPRKLAPSTVEAIKQWHKQELAKVFERIRSEVPKAISGNWNTQPESMINTNYAIKLALESLNNIEKELI